MENKITYTKVGDYYIPNLTIRPSPSSDRWGFLCFVGLFMLLNVIYFK